MADKANAMLNFNFYMIDLSEIGFIKISSTLLDYIITIFRIVIPAWIAGIQAPWMDWNLPFMALDTRFPAGMTSLRVNLTK